MELRLGVVGNGRCDVLCSGKDLEGIMADPHQVISIMATGICDARKDHPDYRMDPEEAKQIAKCIVEALTDSGSQVAPITKN
jgi:hypothetical protein